MKLWDSNNPLLSKGYPDTNRETPELNDIINQMDLTEHSMQTVKNSLSSKTDHNASLNKYRKTKYPASSGHKSIKLNSNNNRNGIKQTNSWKQDNKILTE